MHHLGSGEDTGPGTDPEIPTKGCGRSPDAEGEPSKCSHVRDVFPAYVDDSVGDFTEKTRLATQKCFV